AMAVLDGIHSVKQLERGDGDVGQDHGVEVAGSRLVETGQLDGARLDQAGCGDNPNTRDGCDVAHGGPNGRLPVAQVAAQGDYRTFDRPARHSRTRVMVTDTSAKGTVMGALG